MKTQKVILFLISMSFGVQCFAQNLSIEERNERIRQRWNRSLVDNENYVFNKEANNLLANTTNGLEPGSALVVAMGQGRNALFLARNGWQVTGFDLADKAVAFAEAAAEKEGLKLTTKIESFDTYDFGEGQWDLITWLYGGCLAIDDITAKLKRGLKPGGLFVFEFFHREAGIEMGRPTFGCEANSIKEMFENEGGFEVLLYEEKEGIADYGMDKQKLIYMVLSRE